MSMVTASAFSNVLPATADSARVVAHVYALSLSALVPVGVAGAAMAALRQSKAASRVAVLRAAVIALFVIYLGALLPIHRVAWIVPAGLASPLIALGRMQVGAPIASLFAADGLPGNAESLVVQLVCVVYVVGALTVLSPLAVAAVKLARITARATPLSDGRIAGIFNDAMTSTTVRRHVRLALSDETNVPMTWGLWRPVILLPASFAAEDDSRLRAVFLHELSHVKCGDAAFAVLSRMACAILWFHPAAWWLNGKLREDCEVACDDRVLDLGIRQSDYAELLADASGRLQARPTTPLVATAICQRAGLRLRLRTIVDPARGRRRSSRFAGALAMSLTMAVSVPASMVQLAPTRSVLNALMRDRRWESRAYAVLGLAQRPDSIDIARSAARTDPDPNVRAWARYAVSREILPDGRHR